MNRLVVWAALTITFSAVGFYIGRQLKTTMETAPRAPVAKTSDTPRLSPAGRSATQPAQALEGRNDRIRPTLDSPPTVLGRPLPPPWTALVDEDPLGAARLKRAVLDALETRRRDGGGGAACFDERAMGRILVAFWVSVTSSAAVLEIGDASFHHVSEGTPLSTQTTECLETVLTGAERLELEPLESTWPAYDGPVEYRVPFFFSTRELEDN